MRHEWIHHQKNGPPIRCIACTLGDQNRPVPGECDLWLTDADVSGVEILRLAERVRELECDIVEEPGPYFRGLAEGRREAQDRIDALEAQQLADRAAVLEVESPLLPEIRAAQDRIAELQEDRMEDANLLLEAAKANASAVAALKRLEEENSRLRLSDARLTSLRLEVETLKLEIGKLQTDKAIYQNETARLRTDLREAIATGEEQQKAINALALQAHLLEALLKPIQEHHQEGESALDTLVRCLRERGEFERERDSWKKEALWIDRKMAQGNDRLSRLDALLSSEEVPEGLTKAMYENPRPPLGRTSDSRAWRWFRDTARGPVDDPVPEQAPVPPLTSEPTGPLHLSTPYYRATPGAKLDYDIPLGAASVRVEIHDLEPLAWRLIFSSLPPLKRGGDEFREVNGFTKAEVPLGTSEPELDMIDATRYAFGAGQPWRPSWEEKTKIKERQRATGEPKDTSLEAAAAKADAERSPWRSVSEIGYELTAILSNHCGERGDNEGAVQTLERIIREREGGVAADRSAIAAQDHENAALLEILREVEWIPVPPPDGPAFCPACGYPQAHSTHAPYCRLGLALAGKGGSPADQKTMILAYLENYARMAGPILAWHIRRIRDDIEADAHLADSMTFTIAPYEVVEEQDRADAAAREALDGIVERKLSTEPTGDLAMANRLCGLADRIRGGREEEPASARPWFADLSMEEVHQRILLGQAPGSGQPGGGVLVPEGFLNWLSGNRRR